LDDVARAVVVGGDVAVNGGRFCRMTWHGARAVVGIRPPTSLDEGRGRETDVADAGTVGRR